MEETVKERLIKFYELKKLTKREFEKSCGLSNGYIDKLRNCPSPQKLEIIYLRYPDLNRVWLLTGEGSMLIGQQPDERQPVTDFPHNAVPSVEISEFEYAGENRHGGVFYRDRISGKLFMSAPHVPFVARAEYPNESEELEPDGEWDREIYNVDRVARGRYFSFTVDGNSMDNGRRKCLQHGDKVLARELERENWRTLRAGDHRYWVIVFGSSVLIKEITAFNPETGDITCHSLNPSPEYQDFTINLDDVRYLFYGIKLKPHDENI